MSKLIGIAGGARQGKDTLAGFIVRRGYKQLAFANSLKATCAYIAKEETWVWFDDESKEEHCKSLNMTRRQALQKVGKALRDSLGEDVWVNRLLSTWVRRKREPVVISDVRYENEARAIKALGGVIVRVVRPGAGLSGEAAQHESEKGIPDDLVDIEIYNDGSLSELEAEAIKVVTYVEKCDD